MLDRRAWWSCSRARPMAARAKTSESEGRQPDPRTTFWTPSDDEVVFYVPPAFWPFSDGGEQKTKQTNKKLYLRTRVTVRGFHPVRWMDDPSWRKSRPRLCEWCAEWSVTIGIPRNLMQLATANRLPVANRRDKCREDATSLAGDTNIPEVLKHPRCPHALFCVLDSPASLVLINCTAGYHQAPCVAAWLMAKLAAL